MSMIELNQLSYTAIITISLPGDVVPAKVVVTLTPNDTITESKGRVLPLRDCTLADLQQYADRIERAIAAEFGSFKLADLAQHDDIRVKVILLNETDKILSDNWRDHALLIAEEPRPTEQSAAPAEAEAEAPSEVEEVEEVDQPAEGAVEAPEVGAEQAAEEVAPEAVDETSQVKHVATPPPTEQVIRVAGRVRPLGVETWMAGDILIDEPALRAAEAHAISSLDREVAGVLVGPRPQQRPDGRYIIHVTDTIIAKHTRMHGASVTYTPESWRYLNDELAARYPDDSAMMVGWYHTHPGFGIFLSGMDLFIHQSFFTQIWHIALVLDPLARQCGFFGWDRRQTRVDRYPFDWPVWAAASW